MKKMLWIILSSMLLVSHYARADENPTVTQGAQEYDWQSCVNSKINDCVNDCSNSEDINCNDNCNKIAKDKCLSEGYTQPQ